MSIDDLKAALDALDEPTSCEGFYRLDDQLAVMLPDGDVGALGDPRFVDWLLAHSELAPFGDGFTTRVDPGVRNVQRVTRSLFEVASRRPAAMAVSARDSRPIRTATSSRSRRSATAW